MKFRQDFEDEDIKSVFCCWCLVEVWSLIFVEILKLCLVTIVKFKFCGDGDVWLKFWIWCLVEILKKKFDQDLCLNFWYDFKKLYWQDELNPRVRCAFGNVFILHMSSILYFSSILCFSSILSFLSILYISTILYFSSILYFLSMLHISSHLAYYPSLFHSLLLINVSLRHYEKFGWIKLS